MNNKKPNNFKYEVEKSEVEGLTLIKVKAVKGYFHVTLCDLGASIYDVFFLQRRMTLTPRFYSTFKRGDIYHGKTIGRVNGRIKDASIIVDSIKYQLDNNEGKNTLHGGRGGLSTKYFDYEVYDNENSLSVVFKYISPHLEAGFPEEAKFMVTYLFPKDVDLPMFFILFDGRVERLTPIKLTNHTYWCLGDPNIKNLKLDIKPKSYALYEEKSLLPLNMKKVQKLSNFKEKYLIDILKNENFENGLDNYFELTRKKGDNYPDLILSNDHSAMAIYTDFPGIHLYSDNKIDGEEYFHTKSKNHRAIAIEPSLSPFDPSLVDESHPFHHYISYQFFSLMK